MENSPTQKGFAARWTHWLISLLGVAAVVAFVLLYPPAKELAWETCRIVFSLIFTPFLLEIFCVIAGLFIVVAINNYRRSKEMEDEWVYLHQVDPEASAKKTEEEGVPESIGRKVDEGDSPDK